MNVFETHRRIVDDYARYIRSFININDPAIQARVDQELSAGKLWPDPLLQFNPAYEKAGRVSDIVGSGTFHQGLTDIFTGYELYRHQLEAINLGREGRDFVVTSGTGSGKSLTYIGTIFNQLLTSPDTNGVFAIIVYPMNALINSQTNEFNTYAANYQKATGQPFPITYGQYTGQEKDAARQRMREKPPQVLLTNYMMLELLLTRVQERSIRDAIYKNLRYMVFDELHTYRGRQGGDVAMLIRRITAQCQHKVSCIGTSATMVSVGSAESQKQQVAEVATTMFGRKFAPDQIVNETLTRSLTYQGQLPHAADLAAAIEAGIDPASAAEVLFKHPVAIWLENRIAVEDRDGVLVRRAPMTISDVVKTLAEESGVSVDRARTCLAEMLLWISNVNHALRSNGSRYTVLPFKLHQFIAQTGSVYTTLDEGADRFITMEPGMYKPDEPDRKPIYPNVFSRATGSPFICVSRVGDRLEPREFRERSADNEDQPTDGYLILGESIWNPEEDFDNLPEAWVKRTRTGGFKADSKKEPFFPRKLWFDEYGNCSEADPKKSWGWFMRAPLLFDPTGGVFFDTKTNEGTKLTKLGSEGRSTSTTITASAVLNQLHEAGYHPRDQKLLSFTDNRQDAALQAGHFNDFLQVVQLRAAIHAALKAAAGQVLTYTNVGEAIFNSLKLPFLQYANTTTEPSVTVVRRGYEQSLQKYLFYRAVADLRRSWRIVLPNLEQCGLLTIEYEHLAEVAGETAFWTGVEIAENLSAQDRQELLETILDFFRLEYALQSENFLTPSRLKESEKEFREKLRAPWTLDRDEDLREPYVLRMEPLHRGAKLFSKSMGTSSALGKYLKQFVKQKGLAVDLRGDRYARCVLALIAKLVDAQYLAELEARNESNVPTHVYRLKIDKIIWTLGDGQTVKADVIKRRSYKDQKPQPNEFFREMYRRDYSPTKRLRAEDHTGQLNVETRQDREDRFRAEWYLDAAKTQPDLAKIRNESISALFCSPTMELGIDIGGLSVVHLRNAPPNPSNYAQRSGRAGRSGQGALIFTYCSSYSPHDRHYFQHQAELVAGAVQAPRLDLRNRELLLTHLNALAISEIGLPGLDTHGADRPSLMKLVSSESGEMPLDPGVREGLQLLPALYATIKSAFGRVVADFEGSLTARADWYSDTWIDQNLGRLADHLDGSLERWRVLYRSARSLLTRATQPIESGRLSVGSDEYRKAKRLQDQANRQLNLLRNDAGGSSELSEFYPYRYLAAEGFLPGYNFTRLPLRIFVPTGSTSGEFISRPRHIALREFGPLNVIYHSGRKYRVTQMVIQDAESALTSAKISTKAGYFLVGDERQLEICPFTGLSLGDTAHAEVVNDLLEMTEARAEETDRISCEEEERISKGYDIATFFAVDGGQKDRVKRAVVKSSENDLLNIRYIPAARLVHVNMGWRSTVVKGFPIGLTSGDWRSSTPDHPAQFRETFKLVKLWTSNLADALYIEPIQPLGLKADGVVTLQYALKRAIEAIFQVEPNEIGVVAMGDNNAPNILLYEASEGSLGILSQFVDTPQPFLRVVNAAKRICRFDDATYKAPASYDDLLSYYNQRDHKRIDRFLIQDALEKLALCEVEIISNEQFGNYDEHYEWMLRNLDPNSSTERAFINHLYEHGLRLPDSAQKRVDGIYCQPDFYYEPRTWIFCDGTPHDQDAIRDRDEEQRQLIIARGDEVWSWHYREDLAVKVALRPDIFRKVR
jgi:superfamily II DNA/RNA helicase